MDIENKTVMLLGGSGLVGLAVARALVPYEPKKLVLTALTRDEVEPAAEELRAEAGGIEVATEWGDMFWPESLKDRSRGDVLADETARAQLLDDLYGDLTDDVVRRSTFASILDRHRPEIVVDCVNTATTFAYQNIFASAASLREKASADDGPGREEVERHLATLYLPQLIRHVQIALEAMRQSGTEIYLKIGTAGTGGQGLNIPFTHSEERPSRMLLAKSGLAGAHTLLLYLMARTPDAPAVKEIKPTAAISWKRIEYGEVKRRGKGIERYDAASSVPVDEAFGDGASSSYRATGDTLHGVYVDAGENGLFSLGEFETLTALGLMEYITPEEIADDVVREIRGYPTGHDVVAALDASTSGPTYRAGVLREVAIARMEALEREHGVESVAYEMLGPPRLSKLLFEVAILRHLYPGLDEAAELDPEDTARRADELIGSDDDLRVRILSIGLPILLPDGQRVLRGETVKLAPEPGQAPDAPQLVENGWVDLRPSNWARWQGRLREIRDELDTGPSADDGSRADREPHDRGRALRPGRLAAWVFRHEDAGERIKRSGARPRADLRATPGTARNIELLGAGSVENGPMSPSIAQEVHLESATAPPPTHRELAPKIKRELHKRVVGQEAMIDRLLIGMLTGGHVLLEGVPGLGKTLTVSSLAETLDVSFQRIQFTPDLLPADVVGTNIYNQQTGEFTPRRGPIFAQIVLADEINRAPPKVQSALLEAMQERQVTIAGETFRLDEPFLVLATQNPIEQEGTYPLPEAQVDRFMLKLKVTYPDRATEKEIMRRMAGKEPVPLDKVASPEEILAARQEIADLYVDEKITDYIVDLVHATREPDEHGIGGLGPLIEYGASPRASIFLAMCARAHAFIDGRGYVLPEDVKTVGPDVLRHRIITTYEAEAEEVTPDDIVRRVFEAVEVP